MSWCLREFQQLCKITRGASPRPIQNWMTEREDGIPWIKISDATSSGGRTIERTAGRILREGEEKSVSVYEGDLILSNSATPGIPKFVGIHACIHDGWLLLREFKDTVPEFLFYLLKHERRNLVAQGNGSVFTNLKTDILKNHKVSVPPLTEQKAIAHILGTLDDKIELNQKMNQTLEEIAKAIFKSWFVDFDPVRAKAEGLPTGLPLEISDLFPDELVDSEIGEIPKGWEPTTLSEVTSVIGRGVTPKYCDEGVAILNQKCIRNWSINSNLARSTSSEKKYKEEKYLQEYDCVINSTGVGTLGRVAICDSRHVGMLCDSHVSIVRGITPDISIFTSMRLGLMEPEIENLGHGSTGQTELSRTAIGEIGVTMPSPALLKETKSLLSPFIERRRLLDLENETLSELRDTLLPKLISGELRIPDAEKFLEEAGI